MRKPLLFENSWDYVGFAWLSLGLLVVAVILVASLDGQIPQTGPWIGLVVGLSAPFSILFLVLSLEAFAQWRWRLLLLLLPLALIPWLLIYVILLIPVLQLILRTYYLLYYKAPQDSDGTCD